MTLTLTRLLAFSCIIFCGFNLIERVSLANAEQNYRVLLSVNPFTLRCLNDSKLGLSCFYDLPKDLPSVPFRGKTVWYRPGPDFNELASLAQHPGKYWARLSTFPSMGLLEINLSFEAVSAAKFMVYAVNPDIDSSCHSDCCNSWCGTGQF